MLQGKCPHCERQTLYFRQSGLSFANDRTAVKSKPYQPTVCRCGAEVHAIEQPAGNYKFVAVRIAEESQLSSSAK